MRSAGNYLVADAPATAADRTRGVATRDITISIAEGKDLTIGGALGGTAPITGNLGVNRISPLASASIAHRNLFGTGRYLGFESVISRGQRYEFFLTEREPFLGPWDVPVQFNVFQSDAHRPHAHIRQRGGSIEASKISRLQTRWSVRCPR